MVGVRCRKQDYPISNALSSPERRRSRAEPLRSRTNGLPVHDLGRGDAQIKQRAGRAANLPVARSLRGEMERTCRGVDLAQEHLPFEHHALLVARMIVRRETCARFEAQ